MSNLDEHLKTLKEKIIIRGTLEPLTPLHIGWQRSFDPASSDAPVIKDPRGNPFIPGSSFKGIVRSFVEGFLDGAVEDSKKDLKPCFITDDNPCIKKKDLEQYDQYEDAKERKMAHILKQACPVCRLFGSGDMAARLEIADVFPYSLEDSPTDKKTKIEKMKELMSARSGIKIDRKTGKTKGGALFQYEILGGGELFGEFTFTNFQLYQPGLLFTLFDLSTEGFLRYGHSKSRGLGVLDFSVESIKIIQTGKAEDNTIKGIGVVEKYRDYGFYAGADDKMTIDGDMGYENQFLYSTFTIDNKETIGTVIRQFKEKAQSLLG